MRQQAIEKTLERLVAQLRKEQKGSASINDYLRHSDILLDRSSHPDRCASVIKKIMNS